MIRTIASGLAALIAVAGLAASPANAATDPETPVYETLSCPSNSDVPAEALTGKAAGVNIKKLCEKSVKKAATVEAGEAIIYAFWALGSDVVCPTGDRMGDRQYDTSSLIARAYASAGLDALAGDDWAVSSRNIIGWDGVPRADWSVKVKRAKPGDIIGYKTGSKTSRVTDMFITKKLSITAAGSCAGDIVTLGDALKTGGSIKRTGYYTIDPALARSTN